MRKKKLIIVSYYWPPAGGIGVQRWLQFSKHLSSQGVDVTVVVPEKASYPITDKSLENQVEGNLKVIRLPIWEPYRMAERLSFKTQNLKEGKYNSQKNNWKQNLSLFIRGNFFIPDARIFWVKPTHRFLENYIQENEIANLITTGPPHSVHLIGLKLKNKIPSLHWIADFRDPWTDISYHENLHLTSWARKKHENLETKVLQSADVITAASYSDTESYQTKGARKVVSITNGYHQLEYSSNTNAQFTIAYFGKLEQQRAPNNFWQALDKLYSTHEDFKTNFRLDLWGSVDESIIQELRNYSFSDQVKVHPQVTYKEAKKEMQKADLLLITNFNHPKNKGIIPGKLFEYLSVGKPILSIGPEFSDVEKILQDTHTGMHFTYEDSTKLEDYIYQKFTEWKAGNISYNPKNLDNFSRENLSKKVFELLQ